MIKLNRVGHATFETSDIERAINYYTDVNVLSAREKGRAFLASKTGLLSIALEQGNEAKLKRLSFEVSPNANFADMAKRLLADGVQSEVRSDAVPGIGNVLAFDDPKGTTIELFNEWQYLGSHHQVLGAGPLKLGHIAYFVEDQKTMAAFYCHVLAQAGDRAGVSATSRTRRGHHPLAITLVRFMRSGGSHRRLYTRSALGEEFQPS
jgi:catechol 2,3-dioxygenase-like lactoylglutathione lyase family enzyme